MGRFATTAALYEKFRPPYPPDFFREVARQLSLSKHSALIDIGTGPGLLALGIAPYVGRITGVDPEPAMLAAAKAAAARAGVTFTLIEGRAEDLPDDIGGFDLVTIGRALHWMERSTLGPLLERLVAPGGSVAVCASFSATDGRNAWLEGLPRGAAQLVGRKTVVGVAARRATPPRFCRRAGRDVLSRRRSHHGREHAGHQRQRPRSAHVDVFVVIARGARRPSRSDVA